MVKLDAAVLGRTIKTIASSITSAADLLQECLDEGMPWTVLGSVEAAVALWVSYGRVCSQPRPAQWVWGLGQTMTLPAHTGAALAGDLLYSDEITFAMLSTSTGAPRGAAAFRACVPNGYTPIGRRFRYLQGVARGDRRCSRDDAPGLQRNDIDVTKG